MIGELLGLAATRFLRREDRAKQKAAGAPGMVRPVEVWDLVNDETEKTILRYLSQAIAASPAQIGAALSLPHSTLVRRLAHLRSADLIVVTGKTSGARYELAGRDGRN